MKLVKFGMAALAVLAIAVIAACSGTATTSEGTASVSQALCSFASPPSINLLDGHSHTMSLVVTGGNCPNLPPIGTTN